MNTNGSVPNSTKRDPSTTGSSITRSDCDYDIAYNNGIASDNTDMSSDGQCNNITVITISNECNNTSTNNHQLLQSGICSTTTTLERLSKVNISEYDIKRWNSLPDLTESRALHGEPPPVRLHGTFPQAQKSSNSASIYIDTHHVESCAKYPSADTAIRLESARKLPNTRIIPSVYTNGQRNSTEASNSQADALDNQIDVQKCRSNDLNSRHEASSSKSQFLDRFPQNLGKLFPSFIKENWKNGDKKYSPKGEFCSKM